MFSIHQLDVNADIALDCRINVSGIREVPYFDLYVPPPSASEVSSQRSIEGDDTTLFVKYLLTRFFLFPMQPQTVKGYVS